MVAAGAVAIVLVVAGMVVYLTVAAGTRGQVDDSLRRLAAAARYRLRRTRRCAFGTSQPRNGCTYCEGTLGQ